MRLQNKNLLRSLLAASLLTSSPGTQCFLHATDPVYVDRARATIVSGRRIPWEAASQAAESVTGSAERSRLPREQQPGLAAKAQPTGTLPVSHFPAPDAALDHPLESPIERPVSIAPFRSQVAVDAAAPAIAALKAETPSAGQAPLAAQTPLAGQTPSAAQSSLAGQTPLAAQTTLSKMSVSGTQAGHEPSQGAGLADEQWLIEDDRGLRAPLTSGPDPSLRLASSQDPAATSGGDRTPLLPHPVTLEAPSASPSTHVAQAAAMRPAIQSPSDISQAPSQSKTAGEVATELPAPPAVLEPAGQPSISLSLMDATAAALSQNPNIRVVAKTQQIFNNDVIIADAFFDPTVAVRVQGAKDDYQLTDQLQSFGGAFTTNQLDILRPLGGINNLSIGQQLRGGGQYELGFGTVYNYFDQVGPLRLVNPAWQSAVNLHVEQPLLAGRGREITGSRIEIAQVTSRQSVELFRAEVNTILRDVELAYWDLAMLEQQAQTYRTLVDLSGGLVKAEEDRLDLGEGIVPDVLEAREQYIAAMESATGIEGQRRQASQQLANLLGFPATQPIEIQTTADVKPGLYLPVLEEGISRMMLRSELDAQRSAIRRAEVEVRQQVNALQPDLRMYLDYAVTGLAERLDDSVDTIADNRFNYAALGFVLQQPIGRRAGFAQVRRAQAALCQERLQLAALQHQYTHELRGLHKQLEAQREAVMLAVERVAVAKEQYRLRIELRNNGEGTLDSVLRTQQRLLAAETQANEALFDYQRLLVQWYYEQGAMSDERVAIAE